MAYMKYCNRSGCNKLIPQGTSYCNEHTYTNAERQKEYDANCRNKKAKAFYNSGEWKAARARAITRDTGIDIYLYITEGKTVPADMVHHITELLDDYSMRCVLDNLISISSKTHKTVIDRAYHKSKESKEKMQHVLRECIKEYQRRIGS